MGSGHRGPPGGIGVEPDDVQAKVDLAGAYLGAGDVSRPR